MDNEAWRNIIIVGIALLILGVTFITNYNAKQPESKFYREERHVAVDENGRVVNKRWWEIFSKDFSIEGKWKSVGSYGFGQAQPGEIVVFDNQSVNLYSPSDMYEFKKEDEEYILRIDDYGDEIMFVVNVINNDYIQLDYEGEGNSITELSRID